MEHLVGKKFRRLTVLSIADDRADGKKRVKVLCDCGVIKEVIAYYVATDRVWSCGCVRKGMNTKHGCSNHPLYYVWNDMKRRCYDVRCNEFKNYGARGIKVCDSWINDVKVFHDWGATKWAKGLQLDRIDVDGDYSPENCRFVTPKVNANNKRQHHLLTFNGISKTAPQWVEGYPIKPDAFMRRIERGWSLEDALTKPVKILKKKKKV